MFDLVLRIAMLPKKVASKLVGGGGMRVELFRALSGGVLKIKWLL